MTLVELNQLLLPAIETELHKIIDLFLSDEKNELRKMVAYHLGWEGEGAGGEAQGKRIRPLLVLLTSLASSGSWEQALPAAVSVELVHNFSLIHDDIQDKSQIRRSRPTLWVKWGIAQAINAGDTMFTLAQLAVQQLAGENDLRVAIEAIKILNQACISLTYGQYLDLEYEKRNDLGLKDYWPMIEGKTAALLSASTELGAVINGLSQDSRSAFRNFGRYLGLAFQVKDDLLGVWGDVTQTGKSTESDLITRKKTFPVLYCLEQKSIFASRWMKGPITTEEVPEIEEMMRAEGAYAFTVNTVNRLTHSALEFLGKAIPRKNEGSDALVELTNSLVRRQS